MPASSTTEPVPPGTGAVRFRRRGLIAAIACITVVGVSFGFSWPLLSLLLESRGVGGAVNGASAAMTALGVVLLPPALPPLLRKLGVVRLLFGAIALTSVAFTLFPVLDDVVAWFPLRLMLGLGVGTLFIVSEAWINAVATDATRGRVMGVYGTVLGVGFVAGTLLLRLTGIEGVLPFAVVAGVSAAAALPLTFARGAAPDLAGRPAGGVVHYLREAPAAMAGVCLFGLIEGASTALLPVYGARLGLAFEEATLLLVAVLCGGIVLQYPIGWIADRLAAERLLIACGAAAAVGGGALPLMFAAGHLLWPWLFLWGGMVEGLYLIGLVMLGARFRGADLAAANAAFVVMYAAGSLVGPVLGGIGMDLWNPHGFPLAMALSGGGFILVALGARRGGGP